MKKYFETICLLAVIFFMFSCASKPLPPPEWRYEKDAIHINLQADSQLNFSDDVPHTLMVCIYQLRDPNVFYQLTGDRDGLYTLLKCGLFDGSVTGSKRFFINPGQESTLVLDRSEGSKYVAVLAGYYQIEKERISRILDIPVIIEKKGWIKRTKISKPGPLDIDLQLGRQQIEKFEEKKVEGK
jgi:type VI secretion system VasD/TssJ family lipoprotein